MGKEHVHFNVCLGNPPYQERDGGAQASAKPVYNFFVDEAKKVADKELLIIPARWYSGGKNLNSFRDEMLHDNHLKALHDFVNANDCFNNVEIKGGVCFFLRDIDHNGDCKVISYRNGQVVSEMQRPLLEPGLDTFIRDNQAITIIHKVKAKGLPSFSESVHSAMTFGLRTFFKSFDSDSPGTGLVKLYANHSQGYIEINSIPKGHEYIDAWKVYVPEAVGSGQTSSDVVNPILGEPNSICTETYVMNGPYSCKEEAENVISFINTKFFHFMLGLIKLTQHTTGKTYGLVPKMDFAHPWTDKLLYEYFGLSEEEINFIESSVWGNKK